MTLRIADRVMETVAAPSGAAAFAIGTVGGWASVAGQSGDLQNFANIPGIASGDTAYYEAFDTGGNSETGLGTYSSGNLARTKILTSSNGGAACSFAGTVTVFCTMPAVYFMPATVAASGTSQGTATPLTSRINVVTSGTGGVTLTVAAETIIVNRSGAAISVWPQSGAAIEGLGTNNPATLANGDGAVLRPISSTQWYAT